MICSLGIEVESVIVDSLLRALLPLSGLCNSANIIMHPFFHTDVEAFETIP